eukprot:6206452-Pleurochrysis_carterae.AAC.1
MILLSNSVLAHIAGHQEDVSRLPVNNEADEMRTQWSERLSAVVATLRQEVRLRARVCFRTRQCEGYREQSSGLLALMGR